eukprot:2328028-Amphidinium_carterae.1
MLKHIIGAKWKVLFEDTSFQLVLNSEARDQLELLAPMGPRPHKGMHDHNERHRVTRTEKRILANLSSSLHPETSPANYFCNMRFVQYYFLPATLAIFLQWDDFRFSSEERQTVWVTTGLKAISQCSEGFGAGSTLRTHQCSFMLSKLKLYANGSHLKQGPVQSNSEQIMDGKEAI